MLGRRRTGGIVADFIQKLRRNPAELEILGDGTQEKPYLLVEDCVNGILFGFEHSHDPVNLFNLGCASSTKVSTIAKMVVEEMGLSGAKLKYTGGDRGWPGDAPVVHFDISRIAGLGWKPRYTSDEAVGQAIRDILGKP